MNARTIQIPLKGTTRGVKVYFSPNIFDMYAANIQHIPMKDSITDLSHLNKYFSQRPVDESKVLLQIAKAVAGQIREIDSHEAYVLWIHQINTNQYLINGNISGCITTQQITLTSKNHRTEFTAQSLEDKTRIREFSDELFDTSPLSSRYYQLEDSDSLNIQIPPSNETAKKAFLQKIVAPLQAQSRKFFSGESSIQIPSAPQPVKSTAAHAFTAEPNETYLTTYHAIKDEYTKSPLNNKLNKIDEKIKILQMRINSPAYASFPANLKSQLDNYHQYALRLQSTLKNVLQEMKYIPITESIVPPHNISVLNAIYQVCEKKYSDAWNAREYHIKLFLWSIYSTAINACQKIENEKHKRVANVGEFNLAFTDIAHIDPTGKFSPTYDEFLQRFIGKSLTETMDEIKKSIAWKTQHFIGASLQKLFSEFYLDHSIMKETIDFKNTAFVKELNWTSAVLHLETELREAKDSFKHALSLARLHEDFYQSYQTSKHVLHTEYYPDHSQPRRKPKIALIENPNDGKNPILSAEPIIRPRKIKKSSTLPAAPAITKNIFSTLQERVKLYLKLNEYQREALEKLKKLSSLNQNLHKKKMDWQKIRLVESLINELHDKEKEALTKKMTKTHVDFNQLEKLIAAATEKCQQISQMKLLATNEADEPAALQNIFTALTKLNRELLRLETDLNQTQDPLVKFLNATQSPDEKLHLLLTDTANALKEEAKKVANNTLRIAHEIQTFNTHQASPIDLLIDQLPEQNQAQYRNELNVLQKETNSNLHINDINHELEALTSIATQQHVGESFEAHVFRIRSMLPHLKSIHAKHDGAAAFATKKMEYEVKFLQLQLKLSKLAVIDSRQASPTAKALAVEAVAIAPSPAIEVHASPTIVPKKVIASFAQENEKMPQSPVASKQTAPTRLKLIASIVVGMIAGSLVGLGICALSLGIGSAILPAFILGGAALFAGIGAGASFAIPKIFQRRARNTISTDDLAVAQDNEMQESTHAKLQNQFSRAKTLWQTQAPNIKLGQFDNIFEFALKKCANASDTTCSFTRLRGFFNSDDSHQYKSPDWEKTLRADIALFRARKDDYESEEGKLPSRVSSFINLNQMGS